ncbi:MAG: DUF1801 domain-containing protein [Anaerolineae bacterium]
MSTAFEAFVQDKYPAEFHEIVGQLRGLVQQCAPTAQEGVSYNMPVWTVKNIIAYLNVSEKAVTFSFVRGIQFTDTHGLLRGRAKHARFVKFKPSDTIDESALCDYVRQAVEWDGK